VASIHDLEVEYGMSSAEILEMISQRSWLATAVRGGVAEFHLNKRLATKPGIRTVTGLDKDAMHDFDVVMDGGPKVKVECKNASKKRYANGDIKVEVQKTDAFLAVRSSSALRWGRQNLTASACSTAKARSTSAHDR
jgi:hypothetical protein